ncbi:hypothetical protein C8J57DRAFT_1246779 [Mycena rebaudengoi]|nr:hypothetical protein C8J57DRAFT_1246779 [Mycena rebaudengoi]
MSEAVLNIVLSADQKQISTEHLVHVASALNISVPGARNLRFKLRAAIRKHLEALNCATLETSASVADFFNSFESHRKPTLLSIAALHQIPIPEKASVEKSHSSITLPHGLSMPNCVDICNEWKGNNIDPDLQQNFSQFSVSNPVELECGF